MTGERDEWGERLPRKLGIASAALLMISFTVGAGIFRFPATVAEAFGASGPIMLAWVLGGAIALFGALSIAELGAMYPRSGGYFNLILEAYGPLPAFTFGWAELIVTSPATQSAVTLIFAQYLGYFVPMSELQIKLAAVAALLVVGILNHVGVQLTAVVNSLATIVKYAGIALLALLALTVGKGSTANFLPVWNGSLHLGPMLTVLLAVMFTYDGWGDGSRISGEIRDPARNVPKSIALAVGLVIGIYLVINVAYMYLVPVTEMGHSPLVAATAAERIPLLRGYGGRLIAGVVMVSCFGTACASAMSLPRTQYAMADRGLFFKPLARVSPRFRTPTVAIWAITIISILFVFSGSFQQLADRFVLGLWPFYCLCVAAVMVLRRTRPDVPRPYRVWGYPLVPLFFLLAGVAMMGRAVWVNPRDSLITFGLILSGVPLYFVWRLSGRWIGR